MLAPRPTRANAVRLFCLLPRLSAIRQGDPNETILGRRSMPAQIGARLICISVSLGRSSLAPAVFACLPSPLPAGFRPCSGGLARPNDCRLPSGRGSARSLCSRAKHCGGFPLSLAFLHFGVRAPCGRARPATLSISLRGSCSLRSRSPRHACRRA